MNDRTNSMPSWLPALMLQIEHELQRLTAGRHDQRPGLEQELQQIEESIQGWSSSLAKPTLPTAVREAVETEWGTATERKRAIEAELSELTQGRHHAEQLLRPDQVLDRLDHLADVLAANNPTRGNLELSLHIDSIKCCHDGRVTLRMCKLGVIPDAIDLLAASTVKPLDKMSVNSKTSKARRRSKLRVEEEDGVVDLHAQANFIADSDRFVGLGDEFFWIDEFRIPESSCWAAENAEIVFRRRQDSRLSFAMLALEFGVTPPTIGAAIRRYLRAHPNERDEVHLKAGGKRRPKFDLSKFADEARTLWIEGWSKEKLAEKYGCSPPTVHKAIAYSYAQERLPMPTRETARLAKAAEARMLLDDGKRLEEIAATMDVSDVSAREYLRISFKAEGKAMPDLRSRRGA